MATVGFAMTSRPTGRPLTLFTAADRAALRDRDLSRRDLFRQPAKVVAGATIVGLIGNSAALAQEASPVASPVAGADLVTPLPPIEVPATPAEPPPPEFTILTIEEAAMLEALLGRMLPGDADDPGAVEAGVAWYIDHLLATNEGFHERIYRDGPWARPYEGDTPPPDEDGVVWIPAEHLERYGYQSPLTPLAVYRTGLELTNQHAIDAYGQALAMLEPADQDAVIWDLLRNEVPGFTAFSGYSFFQTIRHHIAEGMFSDPSYGGNRDLAGWKLVGYPGAQRGYLPSEIRGTAAPRAPQSMHDLPHFHTGEYTDEPNVVLPVRGSEPEESES